MAVRNQNMKLLVWSRGLVGLWPFNSWLPSQLITNTSMSSLRRTQHAWGDQDEERMFQYWLCCRISKTRNLLCYWLTRSQSQCLWREQIMKCIKFYIQPWKWHFETVRLYRRDCIILYRKRYQSTLLYILHLYRNLWNSHYVLCFWQGIWVNNGLQHGIILEWNDPTRIMYRIGSILPRYRNE
jgi:hypothetical protein